MITHTIEIGRPIEDVFAVLTNVELTGRWYPARVDEWWTSPPPHGVGSTRRARTWVLGRAMENDAVITAYDPPRFAAMKGLSRNSPFEATLAFEPTAAGTRVLVRTVFDLRGPMRLIGPIFIPAYDRGWDKGLTTLRSLMESGEL
ncbi:MAG TPA: SRPBCC family protein [Candidatus Limnocylindria bacterium]|nr:SRPBCC family protein [Candidatus Limnocylindria bacterium]